MRCWQLQLVNRIYRIGQDRPVTVKKFFCASTVEERLLHLRKSKNSGLLATAEATEADEAGTQEADAMAVPAIDGPEEGDGRMDDLRFILGFRNGSENNNKRERERERGDNSGPS